MNVELDSNRDKKLLKWFDLLNITYYIVSRNKGLCASIIKQLNLKNARIGSQPPSKSGPGLFQLKVSHNVLEKGTKELLSIYRKIAVLDRSYKDNEAKKTAIAASLSKINDSISSKASEIRKLRTRFSKIYNDAKIIQSMQLSLAFALHGRLERVSKQVAERDRKVLSMLRSIGVSRVGTGVSASSSPGSVRVGGRYNARQLPDIGKHRGRLSAFSSLLRHHKELDNKWQMASSQYDKQIKGFANKIKGLIDRERKQKRALETTKQKSEDVSRKLLDLKYAATSVQSRMQSKAYGIPKKIYQLKSAFKKRCPKKCRPESTRRPQIIGLKKIRRPRNGFHIYYFTIPSCPPCKKVTRHLLKLKRIFPVSVTVIYLFTAKKDPDPKELKEFKSYQSTFGKTNTIRDYPRRRTRPLGVKWSKVWNSVRAPNTVLVHKKGNQVLGFWSCDGNAVLGYVEIIADYLKRCKLCRPTKSCKPEIPSHWSGPLNQVCY